MKPNGNGMPPINVVHRIMIEFDETNGQIRVEGIPGNKVVALGMLKMAEHTALTMVPAPQHTQSPAGLALLPPGSRLG